MARLQHHSRPAYTRTAVAFHWLTALLILLNFSLGLYMETFQKHTLSNDVARFYHASFGSLILMIAVLRLLWRATHRPLPLPASVPRLQATAAHLLHWLLYVLMLAIPATGYIHRLAGAHPVNFFGPGFLPVFISKNEPLRLLTDTLHDSLVWVLAALITFHLAAAIKHRLIDRDGIAERMTRVR
ncbi:cytochrome b [Burkholderia cepacia]|uniref:cytochrome b n=1 Tax=Burkholderia cepacia TaxID=292 RepID=UPI001589C308|nr:cytochrome b [Burkholderia cepacia]